jgi:hypothetical protein
MLASMNDDDWSDWDDLQIALDEFSRVPYKIILTWGSPAQMNRGRHSNSRDSKDQTWQAPVLIGDLKKRMAQIFAVDPPEGRYTTWLRRPCRYGSCSNLVLADDEQGMCSKHKWAW